MANKNDELMKFLSDEEKAEYEKMEKKLEEQKKKGTSGTGKMAFFPSPWLDILIELSSLLRRNSW